MKEQTVNELQKPQFRTTFLTNRYIGSTIVWFTNIYSNCMHSFQTVLTIWKLAQCLPTWQQQLISLMYADGFQVLQCNIVRYRLMKFIICYPVLNGRNMHNLTGLVIQSISVSFVASSLFQVTSRYLTENVFLAFT